MIDPSVKQDLREIGKKLTNLRGLFDLDLKQEMIENFEEKMSAPDFWDDNEKAQAVIAEMNAVKGSVDQYAKLQQDYDDALMMAELADEEGDEELATEIGNSVAAIVGKLEEFELQLLLNQPYDKMNAILELHPGAGGTESQDWGQMLLRMYTRWAEKRGFKVEVLDYLPGDEAGIKSVTLSIKGHNAYGYLKAEKGFTVWCGSPLLTHQAVDILPSYLVMWCRRSTIPSRSTFVPKTSRSIRIVQAVRVDSILTLPIPLYGLHIYRPEWL